MKFRPLHDRVLVERIEEELSAGGIVIPDQAKEKPCRGKVVAVGPGKFEDGKHHDPCVKVGDVVIFTKYGGTEVKIDGKEHTVLNESDILGVYE
ncbi:MAG: co-chaperone GroES [Pseudomonadota bacterium]